jgi:hypothetical protein
MVMPEMTIPKWWIMRTLRRTEIRGDRSVR